MIEVMPSLAVEMDGGQPWQVAGHCRVVRRVLSAEARSAKAEAPLTRPRVSRSTHPTLPSARYVVGGEVNRSADAARAEILYDARRLVTSTRHRSSGKA